MNSVAIYLRALQFFAHNAHNLAKGPTFLEDHEYLGELYGAYESAYDSVVERMIGEGMGVDLCAILEQATKIACSRPVGATTAAFRTILETEKKLRAEIDKANPTQSLGTQNLLQDLADRSLERCYKIQQRVAVG